MRNAVVVLEVAMVAASRNRSVGKLRVVMMLLLFYLGRSIVYVYCEHLCCSVCCSSGEEHAHLMILVCPFSIFGTFLMRHVS